MKIQSSSYIAGVYQHGERLSEPKLSTLQSLLQQPLTPQESRWIDLEDPSPAVFSLLAEHFQLPAQLIADHFSGIEKPHLYFKNCVLFRTERVFYHFETERCSSRNLCGILTANCLITLRPLTLSRLAGHVFAALEARGAEVLCKGPSAILPLLFDELIEDYKPVLEDWQNDIDHFEQNCLNNTSGQMLSEILRFKKLVTQLRHSFNKVFRDQRRLLIACPETYLSAGNRAQLSQAINRLGGQLLERGSWNDWPLSPRFLCLLLLLLVSMA
jgi:Mg2+ and Co2+ transporter CorA